jgi:hypothetical protein
VTPEERQQARREFVRRAHPDVGGDPEVFRLGMRGFEDAPADAGDDEQAPGRKAADRAQEVGRRLLRD